MTGMAEYTVEFVTKGATITVSEKETILDRCLEEGINQEYSCRVGMCLACSARIIEGDVVQPAAHALPDHQRDSYALTCMARPKSDLKLKMGEYPPSIDADAGADAAADD